MPVCATALLLLATYVSSGRYSPDAQTPVPQEPAGVVQPPVVQAPVVEGAVAEGVVLQAADEKKVEPAPVTAVLGKTNTQSGEARRNENIFISAVDNNVQKEVNLRSGTTATIISEFSSASRYFGAEYGNSPVGPMHLAGSRLALGGLHGQAYWTHGNSVFSARSFFQAGPVKPARDNQFGVRVTAELWKNAFVTLEGSETRTRGFVNGNILVPRPDERTCLSLDPRVCAIIDRWFLAWPAQAPNRTDIDQRALNTNAPQALDTDTAAARIDQIFNQKYRLTARYAWLNQNMDAFELVAGQNPDTTTKSHDARLTFSAALTPRSILDLTTSFTRARTLLVPEPNAVGPQVQVGTSLEKLGPGSSVPLDRVQNRYRDAVRLSRQDGNHNWSAGYELGRLQFNGSEVSSNRGNYYFRSNFGNDAITNFRLGEVDRYSFGLGGIERGFRRWEQHAFVHDVWRIAPRLTISYGIRYQPQQGIQEVNGLTKIPFRCDCNNFGPSLGLAWRAPKALGVFRAAYSLQYGEVFPATLQQDRWDPPLFQKVEAQNPDFLDPLSGTPLGPGTRAIVFHVPADLRTPYSHQYNFSWDLPLPRAAGQLQLGYVGTRTWKLFYMIYENRAQPVPGVPQTTPTITQRRPDPRYFDYRDVTNGARAYYDAGRISYTLPAWRGLTLDTAYWWSKAIDTGATYLSLGAGDDAMQSQAQTQTNVTADLRGPSAFDQRHSSITRLSYMTGKPTLGFASGVLANWRGNAIFLAKTGAPFTVYSGSDGPGFGNVDGVPGDRPNLLDPSILGRAVTNPDASRTLLPRSAFAFMNPTDTRGNLGMNTFRRGGIRNLNVSLERRWSLSQERAIAFRAESINFLNTPQFAEPVTDLSNPAFGLITNTLNDGRTFKFTLRVEF